MEKEQIINQDFIKRLLEIKNVNGFGLYLTEIRALMSRASYNVTRRDIENTENNLKRSKEAYLCFKLNSDIIDSEVIITIKKETNINLGVVIFSTNEITIRDIKELEKKQ